MSIVMTILVSVKYYNLVFADFDNRMPVRRVIALVMPVLAGFVVYVPVARR